MSIWPSQPGPRGPGTDLLLSLTQFSMYMKKLSSEANRFPRPPQGSPGNSWSQPPSFPPRALLTLAQLNETHDNDGNESEDFGVSEHVLHTCAPLDIGTVHKCQQT